ncbi:tagatose-1,6-bisphosphate aldolase non-catalytic subunit AgaZ/GatZ [Constrictibacter sp. MBR-5]|uniref:hypothetical protein n=1 Tax=Constrictibacter sp. MBR-5 TaxID=3156467 RepID=UPI003392FAE2
MKVTEGRGSCCADIRSSQADVDESPFALIRSDEAGGVALNDRASCLLETELGAVAAEAAARRVAEVVRHVLNDLGGRASTPGGVVPVIANVVVGSGADALRIVAVVTATESRRGSGWVAAIGTERVGRAQAIRRSDLLEVDRLRSSAMAETIDAVLHHVRQPSTAALNFLSAASEAVKHGAPQPEVLDLIRKSVRNVQELVRGIQSLDDRLGVRSDADHSRDAANS